MASKLSGNSTAVTPASNSIGSSRQPVHDGLGPFTGRRFTNRFGKDHPVCIGENQVSGICLHAQVEIRRDWPCHYER